MTIGDIAVRKVNALLTEIGSFYRYRITKSQHTEYGQRKEYDVLEMVLKGAELEAHKQKARPRGSGYRYEHLTNTYEIYDSLRVLEDLIEKLQEEGLLKKKEKIQSKK